MVFDKLEVFLPRLVILGKVGERDHLSIEPQAWLHRLKHRGVLNVDEAKLTWQVPHEVLVVGAVQLHPTQEVHRLEPLGGMHEVGRCQGRWCVRQEETIVILAAKLGGHVGNLDDSLTRHDACQWQALHGAQEVVDIDGGNLDRRRSIATSCFAPCHAAMSTVPDRLVHQFLVLLVNIARDAQFAVEIHDVHAAVCLLGIHRHRRRFPAVDEVDKVLAIPRIPRASTSLWDNIRWDICL
mmetsp:Transcript_30501/g.76693  ORF Transcript_30501/g.76693 Transcript_30501/m.76693 type:complete len:239 (+) Transcript_30501:490-1206(+)